MSDQSVFSYLFFILFFLSWSNTSKLNEHLNFKLSPHFGILAPQTRFFRARPGGIQKIPHKAHGNFWKGCIAFIMYDLGMHNNFECFIRSSDFAFKHLRYQMKGMQDFESRNFVLLEAALLTMALAILSNPWKT